MEHSRRTFLKMAAASTGVLAVGVILPVPGTLAGEPPKFPHEPLAFVRIASDNTVTVVSKHLDKGQGVTTGLATIVAEELDADWSQIRTEFAPAKVPLYANRAFGIQGTGGSTSIANSWDELRWAGAAMRMMLVEAAARHWKVPPQEITVDSGVVSHGARHLSFGQLAAKAAALPIPEDVALKDPSQFRLIGTLKAKRVDSNDKTDGKAKFGLDIRRPKMVRAVIARPTRFGGKVKSFDAAKAKALPGVIEVVEVPSGVAVIAKDTWSAIQGRNALTVEWDDSGAETRSTAQILAEYQGLVEKPGPVAEKAGDADAALAAADKVIEASYTAPYLAHAPMEPLNAIAELHDGGVEIWAGSQFQTVEQNVVAAILGLKPEQVAIHTTWAGGSFGRRANAKADYIAEAATVAKALGKGRPVQLVWTREDDIHGGFYRPMFHHKLKGGLAKDGTPMVWHHRLAGQSIAAGTPFAAIMVKDGVDSLSVEGARGMPYAIANRRIEAHTAQSPVPVLWWRSVGHSHTGFVVESFIDEMAHAAGKDPLEYRLSLLGGQPKLAEVLKTAAEKAGWGTPLPKGRGRGIAVVESFGSSVAEVAEVTVKDDGSVKVDRVVCVVECGIAVNPDVVKAQMEGGIGYGLGAMLRDAITFTDGHVDQNNFDGYLPIRMADMPQVEVHILPSNDRPTGVGEPGVPPISAAVANAIFAASGKRIRTLPLESA